MITPLASAAASGPPVLCHCHSLRQAARRATALYDAAMAPFGLRISQYAILARLRQSGPMSLQSLAAELVLDRTTLGRNLRPLERDGLVASSADANDRRIRRLVLTEAGLSLMRRARPAWQEAQASFEAQYGPAQAASLQRDLLRLTEALVVPDRLTPED
jgi:DNA-binding MarR family transcriptional regulator